MNCANHADASAVAYCRTCGKPLCANCTRPVKGVIYCEDCLGAKMAGTVPPPAPGFAPGAPGVPPGFVSASPVTPGSGPNPALAGILGAIPFGVGAVYNGQYAKGLAHLVIFMFLVYGSEHAGSWQTVFGFGIAFFIFYQIFDAVRSAKAIQAGMPAPDPFGLSEMVTGGGKIDASKVPTGAIVLILLGVLFLLNTISDFGADRFWPILLIVLGGWMFARNAGLLGDANLSRIDRRYRSGRLMGPAMVLTLGVLFLLQNLNVMPFHRTWPIILLVVGGVKLLGGATRSDGPTYPAGPMPPGGNEPVPPVPPSEVRNG
jgi:hypothetical protein